MRKSSGRRERLLATRLRRRKLLVEPLEPRRLMAAIRGLPGFSTRSLAANDDDSVGPVSMGFTAPINYFGTSTSTVFINNNGNVTFDSILGQYTPFSLSNTNRKILAPFFADVETFSPNIVRYGNDTVDGRRAFGVEWPGVGYYSSASKRNFFELVIIERFDTGAGNFDVEFNYDQIRWETGNASGGTNGLGGSSARVGFASGTSGPFREFVGSAVNGAFLDSNTTTGLIHNRYRSDQNGRYVLTVRGGAVVDPDLQVEAVQVTNLPAISGKTLNIQWNVKNTGNDATPNGWSDRVRVVHRATGAVVANQLIIYDPLAPGNGSIGPGTSRTRSLAVTLPDGNPGVGVFDITVTTDALQQIFEANPTNTSEANNSGTASFTSTLAPYPNLNALMQGVPTGIDALQQFAVTLDVGNTGNGPTNGSWKDRLYLSSTQTVTANSTLLFDVASLSQLAVGGSYRHTFNVTAPQVAEGSYYIIAVSNADSAIFEMDRTNNTVVSPLSIFRPDLKPRIEVSSGSTQITNSTGSLDFGASALDQPIVKTVTIRNAGPTEMTLGTVVVTGGGGFSIVNQPNTTVAAGAQTSFQIRFDAAVMGERSSTISIPNNDPTKNPFTFQVSAFAYANVDLVVSNIEVDASASVGGTVDLTWEVKNQGTGEFRGTFADRVWMSADNLVGSDRFVADFTYTGILLPGQTTTRTQRITLPSDAVGTQYFIVRTDALTQVVETDETNNTAVDDRLINIMAPDLQVYDVQVASVIPTGTQTQVNWKVRNAGTAATPTGAGWSDRVYLSSDATLDAADLQMAAVLNPQALAVNESYASSAAFTIPYGTYGLRYVIIKTDVTTQVVELNETNNVNAGSSTNISWQPPDLRVTNVISQFFAFAGAPMRVSWDVRNVGLTPMLASEANWHDRVWLSTDTTLSANDRSVGEFLHSGLLQPGEGYTQSLDIALPPASGLPAGDYYVIVETDSQKQVKEGPFEANNVTSETSITQIVHTPPPDLVVDFVDTPTSTLFSGQTLNTVFRVRNAGAGDTEPRNTQWSDRVYLSTDNVLDSNDRLISTRSRVGGLAASASYDVSTGIVIPSDVIGVFHVIVVANAFAQVFGDDLTNNTTASTSKITIQKPPADLDVTSVSSVQYVVEGRELTVDYTVRNVGPQATTAASWKDRVYLSIDAVLGPEDSLLAETTRTGTVDAGAEYRGTVTRPVNQIGSFYVIVETDAADEVFEINQANNVQAALRTVNVVPTPADLTTSQVTAPPMVRSGLGVPVSFRVTNTGPSTTLGANWLDRVYISNDELLDAQDTLLTTVAHTGALQATPDFYDAATQLVIPENFNGDYFLIVKADDTDIIFEDDNVDNVSTTPITVVSQPADLIVDSINAAASAESGSSLRVDWTVKNQGTGDTLVSTWRERIYISNDNVFSPGTDPQLSEYVYTHINGLVPGPMDAGRTVSRSELVTLPNTTGQRYLFVVVDATNVVFEPDREDNNASSPLAITINPRDVDLRVTSVTAPATAEEGIPFDVTWTVKNVGTAGTLASHWYDDVYLSSDNELSADDVRLGSLRRTNGLVANAEYSVTSSFAIPLGVVPGSSAPFYLLVKTDGGDVGQVVETMEDNNVSAAGQPTVVAKGTIPLLPNLQVSAIQAPTSGQVGQPITVDWTVQNVGPGAIASGQWIDAVYLSLDKVLDRQGNNRDIYLGFRAQSRVLASGASYSDTATFTLPAGLAGDYYVLVATDSGAKVAEGPANELDNLGSSTAVLTVEPKPPADLVVGTITIPANGVSGQNATITYTVTNAGTDPATGYWYDSLFISSDDVWDVDDRLFDRVLHRGDLLPSASYTESVTAVLPGVLPGDYHIIVRSDIRNQIAEGNEANNIRASLDAIDMDVEALTLGSPANGSIGQGQSVYYKVDVAAGETLVIEFDAAAEAGVSELHVSHAGMPTRIQADASSIDEPNVDRRLVIDSTDGGTYYILAYGNQLSQPTNFSLLARVVQFEIFDKVYGVGGTSGKRTIQINGTKFNRTLDASMLVNGVAKHAEQTYVVNSQRAYATFDLSDVPVGTYDVQISIENQAPITILQSLQAVAGGGGHLLTTISAPRAILRPAAGRTNQFQFSVTWANDGINDIDTPLMSLQASEIVWPTDDPQTASKTIDLVGVGSAHELRGILRPGAFSTQSFTGLNDSELAAVRLFVEVTATRTDEFSWIEHPAFRLATNRVGTELLELANEMERRFGENWKGYATAVASGMRRASLSHGSETSVVDALRLEVIDAEAALTTSISGRITWSHSLRLDSWPTISLKTAGSTITTEVNVFSDGQFAIPNLQPGTYQLHVTDEFITAGEYLEVSVAAGEHLSNVQLELLETVPVKFEVVEVNGDTAAGSLVYIISDGEVIRIVQASSAGRIETSLPAGDYDFVFQSNMTHAQVKNAYSVTTAGLVASVNFEDGAEVSADVRLENGAAIVFASALLQRNDGDRFGSYVVAADAAGKIAFSNIPAGTYSLTVSHAGYRDMVREITIVSTEQIDVGSIQLPAGSSEQAATMNGPLFLDESFAAGMLTFLAIGAARLDVETIETREDAEAVRDVYPFWSRHLIQHFFRTTGLAAIGFFREQPEYISVVRQFVNGDGTFRYFENDSPAANYFEEHPVTQQRLQALFESASAAAFLRIKNGAIGTLCEDENDDRELEFTFQELDLSEYLYHVEGNGSDPDQIWNYGNTIAGGVGSDNVPGVSIGAGRGRNDSRLIEGKVVAKFSGGTVTISLRDVWFTVDDTYDFISGNLTSSFTIRLATVPLAFLEANGVAVDVPFRVNFSVDFKATETRRLEQPRECCDESDCAPPPPPCDQGSTCIPEVLSLDPNDIIGPVGFGPERWVAATQPLDYMIRFENDPVFATAPAQQIRITQTLDSDLDFRTFRLGDFGMGDLLIDVPENRAFYSTRLDLRATKGIYVDVLAGINVTTGEAFWNFTAVDPVTGDLPSDPLKGLLPPNINPPEGDGFVRYSIRAKSTVVTGTRIDAMARIIFDINEPIDTPPIFNTLDAVAPTSQVDPLTPELVSYVGRFPVSWTGSDDAGGSALRGFDIYVRVDDGPYQRWLTDVSYTTALYDGPVGNAYAFYSIAHDNAGLAEPVPGFLDTDIRVTAPLDVAVEVDDVAIPHATGAIDFGSPIVASAPLSKSLTVRNTGKQPLTLSSASLTPDSGFSLLTNMGDGTEVQPGQTTTFVVALNAAQVGSKSATLQFGTNVPGKSPFTVMLKGQVREVPALAVALESSSITETGAFIIGMVSRNTPTDTPLVVSLTSSQEDQGTVPASITIPAGATRVTFRFTPKNDSIADGTQSVSIVAAASGLTSASAIAQVTDDEIATLQMSLAVGSIREDGAPATGTVTRNTPTNVDLVVNLSSSDVAAATVPATVTIPAGSTTATFTVAAVNDTLFDGDQVVEIAASSNGMVSDTAQVTIVDEDAATLLLNLSVSSIRENGGITTGTVTRNTPTTSALLVQLASSDITAATVPESVTIPAGQRSANFDITIVNDARYRGNVNIQIRAQAVGLPLSTAALEIVEDDPLRPWHNALKPLDVNADGVVSPIDALLIINFLNQGMSVLPDPVPGQLAPPPYVDVTQDGLVTPLDALLVINQLNTQAAGEGEQVARPAVDWSAFDDFEWLDSMATELRKVKALRWR